jgi:hypothetical protein
MVKTGSLVLAAGLAGLLLFGCAALGGGKEGKVTVTKTGWRGWHDCYVLSNGDAEVVVVPGIARIMSYRLAGGENVLWVNDEQTPERTGVQCITGPTKQWLHYGGYKLWPAPEKDWGGLPDWQLDRGPCRVEVEPDGALRLIGMASDRYGIRFVRRIRLAPEGSRLEIGQTAVNVSTQPVTASIWDVTQVKFECVGFVPMGEGATCRGAKGPEPDEQWRRYEDVLLVRPAAKSGKVFISGPPAWLGSLHGKVAYVKAFRTATAPPPDPEAPREVYTSDIGYIELEIVGPAVTIGPGESTSQAETWHLVPVETTPTTDAEVARTVRDLGAQLRLD